MIKLIVNLNRIKPLTRIVQEHRMAKIEDTSLELVEEFTDFDTIVVADGGIDNTIESAHLYDFNNAKVPHITHIMAKSNK